MCDVVVWHSTLEPVPPSFQFIILFANSTHKLTTHHKLWFARKHRASTVIQQQHETAPAPHSAILGQHGHPPPNLSTTQPRDPMRTLLNPAGTSDDTTHNGASGLNATAIQQAPTPTPPSSDKTGSATQTSAATTSQVDADSLTPAPIPSPETPTLEAPASVLVTTTVTVRDLTPLLPEPWTLLGRIVARGDVRRWDNVRGSGQFFNFLLIDTLGKTISATVFNEGVNAFGGIIREGAVCSFSGGKVKVPNRSFSSAAHELTFDHRATIVELSADRMEALETSTVGTSIRELGNLPVNTKATVVAIVLKVDPPKRIRTANGDARVKREIAIVDDTLTKVLCTVWGAQAQDDLTRFEGRPVLIERASFNDYQGSRSINIGVGASVYFEPSLPRATRLSAWYEAAQNIGDAQFLLAPEASSRVE